MTEFSLEQASKLFLEGDLPRLFNYIADEYEQRGKDNEYKRIIEVINLFIENSDLPEVAQRLEWLKRSIVEQTDELYPRA